MLHEIDRFVQHMAKKGLSHPGVEQFGEQMVRLGAPEGFLERLASATTYITSSQLEQDIPLLAEVTKKILNTPYVLFTYLPNGSDIWIMNMLEALDVRPPDKIFPLFHFGNNDPINSQEMERLLHLRQAVMIDEWVINGGHVESISLEIEPVPLHVFALYITTHAEENRRMYTPSVIFHRGVNQPIYPLSKNLTRQDRGFLHHLYTKTRDDRGNRRDGFTPSTTLISGDHKTPDNIPSILTGKRYLLTTEEPIAPLFEHVVPPYKNQEEK